MRKTGFVLVQSLMIFYFSFYAQAGTAVIDRIVAMVNGEIITLSELERFKSLVYMGTPEKPGSAEINRRLLDQIIDKRIIKQEAKKLEIKVSRRDVDMAIEDILARNKITLKALQENLVKEGATLEEYRGLLEAEIIQSQVLSQQIQSRIAITDKDIEKYYEQNIKPKEKPGMRVRIQQILFLIPKDSTTEKIAEIEKSAAEIREIIAKGEDFGKMAVTYSQGPAARMGGDLGYFHKGELLPAIEKTAFSMEKGQLSHVIRTPVGFHLIKVLDKDTTEEDRSWKDHEDEIKGILYNQEFEKSYMEWLQGLKDKSYIEINL
jgi:peptidyl-prolyl cis-trans isomerase SurA